MLPQSFTTPLDGRFAVEHCLGAGASGTVYRAFDLERKEPVALKVWNEWDSERDNPAESEGRVLRAMNHPGIVKAIDSGIIAQLARPYLALEWIDGGDLHNRHVTSPLSLRQTLCLGVLLARALAAAHAAGVIHRDLKPHNILLRLGGFGDPLVDSLGAAPVLTDFGIALRGERAGLAGTPAYMSPEQARGEENLDARTDLYSLGATLYELIVGRPPHQGPSPLATLARLATTPAPRLSLFRPEIPRDVDDALDALLRTQPGQRPSDAEAAEALLLRCLERDAAEGYPEQELTGRVASVTTRLVTTIVAMGFEAEGSQAEALRLLASRGAEAVPLGRNAVVSHLGVQRATGDEARAALDLGRKLARSGANVGIASGRVRVSVGTNNGSVHPVGEVVDRAVALAREAKRSELLVDATSTELGRGRYEFRVREDGSSYVGDKVERGGYERSGGAPFVGRETELAQILSAFDRARTDHASRVLVVTGPPGIGKSRLQREAVSRLATAAEPPRVIVQRSDAYGRRQVLGAAADILRALVVLRKGATQREAEEAILEGLGPETLSEVTSENRRRLARLLVSETEGDDGDPSASRDTLWLAMTDLVAKVLSNESILLVVEDLQWADGESIGWLDHLLGRPTRRPLVVLACVRPAFWDENEGRFSTRSLVRLDLRPISRQSVCAIAEAVLGQEATTENVGLIADQAGGSPLFAEELARLFANGQSKSRAPTLESAIQASLDALRPECQEAVQRLSVLGQASWPGALEALGIANAEPLMKELSAREMLVEQSTSRFDGQREYLFKHALVREVAYSTLSPETKTSLHAAAGRWLSLVGEDATTVAGHLDLGDLHVLGADYWERAARRALSANALRDALAMAERSLAFAEDKPTGFRRAQLMDEAHSRLDPRAADRETAIAALAENVYDEASGVTAEGARARYDDARGIRGADVDGRLLASRDDAARLGMNEEVAKSSACFALRCAFAGRFEESELEVQRLLELSGKSVRGAAVDAYQTLAIIRQSKGAVSLALEARKSAVGAARVAGLKERESTLTTNLGFALSTVGARQEAREALERGHHIAETIGSPAALRHAQMNLLGWASLYGTDRGIDALLGETRAEADAAALGLWAAPDRSNLGVLYYRGVELLRIGTDVSRGRALSLLRIAAESYTNLGHRDVLPAALGMWAEAERMSRNPKAAIELAARAVDLLEAGAPSLLNEAPVYLTLYKAFLDAGQAESATAILRKSVQPLLRRVQGLLGSPYARGFLTELPYHAELVAALEAAGYLPDAIHRLLAERTTG